MHQEVVQNPKSKLSQLLAIAGELGVEYSGQSKEQLRNELAQKLGIEIDTPAIPALPGMPELRTKLTARFVELKSNFTDLEPARYREDQTINDLLNEAVNAGGSASEEVEKVYIDVLNAFCGKKRKGRTKEEMAAIREKRAPKEKKEKAPSKKRQAVELTDDMKAVIASETLSKSEKIRQLHTLGLPKNQIAIETPAHYSFVHNTISSFELKKKVEKMEGASVESV